MKKAKQLEFKKVNGWGGKRRGAGRKNKSGTVNHMGRGEVDFKKPLHITKRLRTGLKGLRSPKMFKAFQASLYKAKQKGLNVIHFSIESNHLHLFAECEDNRALAAGMNSLGASFGKAIRRGNPGKGRVFGGRYHLHILNKPREVRNAMAYVLLNHSKHEKLISYRDRFSSADYFGEWNTLLRAEVGPVLGDGRPAHARSRGVRKIQTLPVFLCPPKSWLAREGWRRA